MVTSVVLVVVAAVAELVIEGQELVEEPVLVVFQELEAWAAS